MMDDSEESMIQPKHMRALLRDYGYEPNHDDEEIYTRWRHPSNSGVGEAHFFGPVVVWGNSASYTSAQIEVWINKLSRRVSFRVRVSWEEVPLSPKDIRAQLEALAEVDP